MANTFTCENCDFVNVWPSDDLFPDRTAVGHITDCSNCGKQVFLRYRARQDKWTGTPTTNEEFQKPMGPPPVPPSPGRGRPQGEGHDSEERGGE